MFYAVSGLSGFGVYEDYFIASINSEYISKVRVKEFQNSNDALEWAIDRYNSFHNKFIEICNCSVERFKLNWVYFVKDIRYMQSKY